MEHRKPVSTPLLNSTLLSLASLADSAAHSEFPYRKIVGCLNHVAVKTHPDIPHAVSQLAQNLLCYGSAHTFAAKHLLQYIKGTLYCGLLFRKNNTYSRHLYGYTDADYANDVSTHHATTGYIITLGGYTGCWRSLRQRSIVFTASIIPV